MMNNLNFISNLGNLGILPSDTVENKKYMFVTNILLIGYALTVLIYIPIFGYFYDEVKIGFYTIISGWIIWFSGLYLSSKRLFFGAKMVATLGGIAQVIAIYCVFGSECYIQLFLLAAIPLPFATFNVKETNGLITGVTLLVITYICMQMNVFSITPLVIPSEGFLNIYKYMNIIFSILTAVSVSIFSYSSVRNFELELLSELENSNHARLKSEKQNKDFKDSINYALSIQQAILPTIKTINNHFGEAFVFYKPKDILSGDFYWTAKKHGKSFFAAADCTGHGVPGALLTVVGYELLNIIVHEKLINEPAKILNQLRSDFWSRLTKKKVEKFNNDGMDISLIAIDYKNMTLEFAGAYNPMYLFKNGKFTQIKGDRHPIGGDFDVRSRYVNNSIPVKKGDIIYLFSDGYVDQFGGYKNKKYGYKRFKTLLQGISLFSLKDQEHQIKSSFRDWIGSTSQIDDITVACIKV